MKRLLVLWVALGLMFAACGAPTGDRSYGVAKRLGEGRHIVSNVEKLNNGMNVIWFFGENDYVYCTFDDKLAAMARAIKNDPGPNDGIALYEYRDFITGDPEFGLDPSGYYWWSTCGVGITATYKSKLMSIKPLRPLVNEVVLR